MSSDSRIERERLKEEYKEHYRKMREIRDQLTRARRTHTIQEAIHNMSVSDLMASFDDFVFQLKSRVARVEAQLEVTMEDLGSEEPAVVGEQQDEEERKMRARETLHQLKLEMGQLYSEIEKRADAIQAEKTVGNPSDQIKGNRENNS